METLLPALLIAACVATFVWFVGGVIAALFNNEKRRLQDRLVADVKLEAAETQRSAVTAQSQITGLSAGLVKIPVFASLNRRVVQAFPNMSVAQFVLFAALFGMVALVVAMALTESLIIGAAIGLGVAYVPVFILNAKRNRR